MPIDLIDLFIGLGLLIIGQLALPIGLRMLVTLIVLLVGLRTADTTAAHLIE